MESKGETAAAGKEIKNPRLSPGRKAGGLLRDGPAVQFVPRLKSAPANFTAALPILLFPQRAGIGPRCISPRRLAQPRLPKLSSRRRSSPVLNRPRPDTRL